MTRPSPADDWRTPEQRLEDELLEGTWYRCHEHGRLAPNMVHVLGDHAYCGDLLCDREVLLVHNALRSTEETDWTRSADRKAPAAKPKTGRRWRPGTPPGPDHSGSAGTGPPVDTPVQPRSDPPVDQLASAGQEQVHQPAPAPAPRKEKRPVKKKASRTTPNKTDVILATLRHGTELGNAEIRAAVAAVLGEGPAKRGPVSGTLHQLRARGLIDAPAPGRFRITPAGAKRVPKDATLGSQVDAAVADVVRQAVRKRVAASRAKSRASGECPATAPHVPGENPVSTGQEPVGAGYDGNRTFGPPTPVGSPIPATQPGPESPAGASVEPKAAATEPESPASEPLEPDSPPRLRRPRAGEGRRDAVVDDGPVPPFDPEVEEWVEVARNVRARPSNAAIRVLVVQGDEILLGCTLSKQVLDASQVQDLVAIVRRTLAGVA